MTRKRKIFIKPPRLTYDHIRAKAEEVRRKYVFPPDKVPVPVIEIAEIDLKIEPIPIYGLKEKIDIDGFLTNDLKKICIDRDVYYEERQENRLRFTYAHELGHLILHKTEIQQCNFRTEEDWIHFRNDFLEEDLTWFEQHAYEFAGRLLVPKERLIIEIENNEEKIKKFKRSYPEEKEILIEAVSHIIAPKFKVSPGVINRRIRIEKLGHYFE